jgi:hypothetical protein
LSSTGVVIVVARAVVNVAFAEEWRRRRRRHRCSQVVIIECGDFVDVVVDTIDNGVVTSLEASM